MTGLSFFLFLFPSDTPPFRISLNLFSLISVSSLPELRVFWNAWSFVFSALESFFFALLSLFYLFPSRLDFSFNCGPDYSCRGNFPKYRIYLQQESKMVVIPSSSPSHPSDFLLILYIKGCSGADCLLSLPPVILASLHPFLTLQLLVVSQWFFIFESHTWILPACWPVSTHRV